MVFQLPRFYPILDPSLRPDLTLETILQALAQAGVRLVQLRMKSAAGGEFLTAAAKLQELAPTPLAVLVNDRSDIAFLAGAAGVHLGQDDLPVSAARHLLGPRKLIGLSTHNLKQVASAGEEPVDYLAFGPIFPTQSKTDTHPLVGCAKLREVRNRTTQPLVAIGGITLATAAEVMTAGADSIAVIGGWLSATDLSHRLEEFRQVLGRLN